MEECQAVGSANQGEDAETRQLGDSVQTPENNTKSVKMRMG